MLYTIYLTLVFGVFLVTSSALTAISAKIALRQRLPVKVPYIKRSKIQTYFAPLFLASNFILGKAKLKERLQQKLYASHVKLSTIQFFSLQLLFMAALPVMAGFFFSAKTPTLVVAFILGYLLPEMWLRRKIAQRKDTIARLFPEVIDLLGLCIEAGLDFTVALEWIVRKTRPTPLIEELAIVAEEIKWGKPRAQALKDMAKRFNIPELNSFSQSLIQAERMGTAVVEVFGIISEDARAQRYHRGERFALKAPIKMLIPLVFCILPVIGIVIGGPILIQFMQGNILKGF